MNPVKDRYYYVYILQSLKSKKWYTGFTNDLRKRFNQHQQNEARHELTPGLSSPTSSSEIKSLGAEKSSYSSPSLCSMFSAKWDKSTHTKGRGPFRLIYYEATLREEDAMAREKYLKSGMGKRYLKNRLKRSLALTG